MKYRKREQDKHPLLPSEVEAVDLGNGNLEIDWPEFGKVHLHVDVLGKNYEPITESQASPERIEKALKLLDALENAFHVAGDKLKRNWKPFSEPPTPAVTLKTFRANVGGSMQPVKLLQVMGQQLKVVPVAGPPGAHSIITLAQVHEEDRDSVKATMIASPGFLQPAVFSDGTSLT